MKKKSIGVPGLIAILVMVVSIFNVIMYVVRPVTETNIWNGYETVEAEIAKEAISDGKVESAVVSDGILYYKADGQLYSTKMENGMDTYLGLYGVQVDTNKVGSSGDSMWDVLLVISVAAIAISIIFFAVSITSGISAAANRTKIMMGSMPGQEKQSSITKTRPNVHFDDVQGIDGIKEEIVAAVDALKHPQAYTEIGAKAKKGIILCGQPGTGKTLLAKAMAGEAGVPFFSVSGSDFIEKYVGVGASRIRELYAEAKKNAPCIVFIDEIDAIGGERGDNSNSERDQTINALLTELDGFDGTEGILTVAATNRLDILDSALVRPGRFDLTLTVNLPDADGRYKILRHHATPKKLGMDVDLHALAKRTVGFSGAALEALLNESAYHAVRSGRKYITSEDIDEAFFKIIMKGSKKPGDKNDADFQEMNKIVAWHEAGHALTSKLLTDDGVPSVTIIGSTSGAGGVTFMAPKENVLRSKKYLRHRIMVSYGGRAAEEVLLGDPDLVTTGASADIQSATAGIRNYLNAYGMGSRGLINIDAFRADKDMLEEASQMANDLYAETLELLKNNRETLQNIAEALLEKETISEEELDAIIAGKPLVTDGNPVEPIWEV